VKLVQTKELYQEINIFICLSPRFVEIHFMLTRHIIYIQQDEDINTIIVTDLEAAIGGRKCHMFME